MKYRKRPIVIEAWTVPELNRCAQHDWFALPKVVAADYENPQGQGAWVFGALVTDREPSCVEAWPECEDGGYNPSCCRFPKACSCARDRRGIYIPTLEGNLFAAPDDWIICGVKGEFYPCKPDVFAASYDLWEDAP